MGSDWPQVKFSELYSEPSRNGVTSPKASRGEGTPMVGMGDVFANRRVGSGVYERVSLPDALRRKSDLRLGDLLFARRSLTLAGAGKCSVVVEDFEGTFESSLIRCRLDRRVAVPEFYFHFFQSPGGRVVMDTIVEQTAVAGIRSSDLARLEVPRPTLPEQRRVAAILEAFDDKIELNRRMSGTLDGMAQAIFRGSFVDCARVDWVEGRLSDVVDRVRVAVQPERVGPETPCVGLEHFARRSTLLPRWGAASDSKSGKNAFQRGDILFGKLRPYFHKVAVAPFDGICSTDIMVLRPRASEWFEFALGHVNSTQFIDYATARSEGTRMPRAKWADVADYAVRLPPFSTLRDGHGTAIPTGERQRLLTVQSRQLEQLRDSLLPTLLSGSLQVR